jgi:hypothetical protein
MVLLAQIPKRNGPPKAEVEVFIIRSCLGEVVGTPGMQHLELGSKFKVSEDMAMQLTRVAGAAFFVDAEDDDSQDKRYTLTPQRRAPAESEQKLRRARAAQREEEEAFARASRRALIEKYGAA